MRLIKHSTIRRSAEDHPSAAKALSHWETIIRAARYATMSDIQAAFPKAKVLDGERVRFPIAGGDYRLVVAFDLEKQIAFIKFFGTHAEYDKIDALTVSRY